MERHCFFRPSFREIAHQEGHRRAHGRFSVHGELPQGGKNPLLSFRCLEYMGRKTFIPEISGFEYNVACIMYVLSLVTLLLRGRRIKGEKVERVEGPSDDRGTSVILKSADLSNGQPADVCKQDQLSYKSRRVWRDSGAGQENTG